MSDLNPLVLLENVPLTVPPVKFPAPRSRGCLRALRSRLRNLLRSNAASHPAIPGISSRQVEHTALLTAAIESCYQGCIADVSRAVLQLLAGLTSRTYSPANGVPFPSRMPTPSFSVLIILLLLALERLCIHIKFTPAPNTECYLPRPSSNEYLRRGSLHPVERAEIIT
jgi:hypothetical protein